MNGIFKEVRSRKVSEEIANQIKSLITEGSLRPGEKLPPEREMADMLGVGRSSLREAINTLETLGFIEIKKRKGNFVKGIESTLSMDPLKRLLKEDRNKLGQVYEIREDIELASAYYAARCRTEKDLERIRKCLLGVGSRASGAKYTWVDDREFHIAIAQATGNFLRVHLVDHMFDYTSEFLEQLIEKALKDDEKFSTLIKQHEGIYRAIHDQDELAARNLMQEHLHWGQQQVQ